MTKLLPLLSVLLNLANKSTTARWLAVVVVATFIGAVLLGLETSGTTVSVVVSIG